MFEWLRLRRHQEGGRRSLDTPPAAIWPQIYFTDKEFSEYSDGSHLLAQWIRFLSLLIMQIECYLDSNYSNCHTILFWYRLPLKFKLNNNLMKKVGLGIIFRFSLVLAIITQLCWSYDWPKVARCERGEEDYHYEDRGTQSGERGDLQYWTCFIFSSQPMIPRCNN